MARAANIKPVNIIIPRYLTNEKVAAAFFNDTIYEGKIPAYVEGKGLVMIDAEVYEEATEPLNSEEIKYVADKYAQEFGLQDVVTMRRRRYKKDVSQVPSKLNIDSKLIQKAADEEKNEDTQKHLQALADQKANEELVKDAQANTASFQEEEKGAGVSVPSATTRKGRNGKERKPSPKKAEAARQRWAKKKAEQAAKEQAAPAAGEATPVKSVADAIVSAAKDEDIPASAIAEVSEMMMKILIETVKKHRQTH